MTINYYFIHSLVYTALLLCCTEVIAEINSKQICFNFYVVSKQTNSSSELEVFAKQKQIALTQLSRAQTVFDENIKRNCPQLKFEKGNVNKISWKEALDLSLPLDFDRELEPHQYYLIRTEQALKELREISSAIKQKQNMKYYLFLEYSPVRKIVYAENALQKLRKQESKQDSETLGKDIKKEIEVIKQKLNSYGEYAEQLIAKDRERVAKYESTDAASAASWEKGIMILWNDIEAQNTSIELKNLLKKYRSPENQCLDVYIIPDAKTPSRDISEVNGNGRWTQRGGAAISSRLFPRTTANKGHAILLTYNTRPTENRLAHELGHLLIHKKNAHKDKKEKDLMFADSKGGSYLNEDECDEININIKSF